MLRFSIALVALSIFQQFTAEPILHRYQVAGVAQGTTYNIMYYAADSVVKKAEIDSILRSIDTSLSLYKSYSLVNRFNNSPEGVVPDRHFKAVVKKAFNVNKETKGVFDITIFPLTDVWGFGPIRREGIPDSSTVLSLRGCIDSRLLYWKKDSLKKKSPCVKLDPNGIAQGYSVDVLADWFKKKKIRRFVIELGGEIRVEGTKPGGQKMSVGIESPQEDPFGNQIEKIVWLNKGGITTSGNYRRYRESNGKKYGHVLDPRSGFPVTTNLISVTVYAKDAMTADAYDNALMAMGLEEAMHFVEKHKELAAHFIYLRNDGTVADTASRRFRKLTKQ